MRQSKLALALAVLFAMAGCSLAPGGDKITKVIDTVIDTGIEDRQAYNDKKGQVLLVLPCDVSIGAYFRIPNAVQQEALQMLCSGKRLGEPSPQLGINAPAGAAVLAE